MKDFTERDQRIAREFGKYRLPPPSAELHDRVLQAAREALASGNAELHWTARWLRACRAYPQEILAFASSLMLILGVVMQLGGGQSVLADSIERMGINIVMSGRLDRATSMDCTVLNPGSGSERSRYRVRWIAAGITRVDMDSNNSTEETLWISKEKISGAVSLTSVATMPSQWQPVVEFITPAILARYIEGYKLMQAERQDGARPGELLFAGQKNQQVIEVAIDVKTRLPLTVEIYSAGTSEERHCLKEVRFRWNRPIPPELLIPGSSEIKQRID